MATHKYTAADESATSLIKKSKASMKPLGSNEPLYELVKGEQYSPHEDYILLKNGAIATMLTLDFEYGNVESLPMQWGVRLLSTTTKLTRAHGIRFVQITTLDPVSQEWIRKADKATNAVKSVEGEISDAKAEKLKNDKTSKAVRRRGLRNAQLKTIKEELDADGQYFAASFKFLITAPSLEEFDEFFREYKHKLRTDYRGFKLITHLEGGENVYRSMFTHPLDDLGRPPMFTNAEFGGYYHFLSQGVSDRRGMYVGEQVGDVNNMSVLWDMTSGIYNANDGFAVIVGNRSVDTIDRGSKPEEEQLPVFTSEKTPGSSLWLHQLTKQYLMRDPKVKVRTLAFSPFELSPLMSRLSKVFDLSLGIINPLEMFKIRERDADINTVNNEKWEALIREMASASQAREEKDVDAQIVAKLTQALEKLYMNAGMRTKNLTESNKRTRLAGIYHGEVPSLLDFTTTLATMYDSVMGGRAATKDMLEASIIRSLNVIIEGLLSQHGDLFNVKTSPEIDEIGEARHDVFNFSKLKRRSRTAMMLQLINSIDLILADLDENDLIVLYGCDELTNFGLSYLVSRLKPLLDDKGVKLVCMFNTIEGLRGEVDATDKHHIPSIATNSTLNILNKAHYVLLGNLNMTTNVDMYNELVEDQYKITSRLVDALNAENSVQNHLSSTVNTRYYLRRHYENIVFDANPIVK